MTHSAIRYSAWVLKRIGKVVVVVVGVAGAAGVLSHHRGDSPEVQQQWIAHPGAPEPDHGQHCEYAGPRPSELPRGVRIATRPEVNRDADGRELPVAPIDGTTAAARALTVVGAAALVGRAFFRSGPPRRRPASS